MISEKCNTNQLISLIYETASDGEKWPDLIDALVNFIHQVPSTHPTPTLIDDIHHTNRQKCFVDTRENASLAGALQQLRQPDAHLSINSIPAVSVPNEQEEINQLLLGHFSKALNIAKQIIELQEKHEATLSILDQLPIALIVVDKEGAIIESNLSARQLLSETHILNSEHGLLQASDRNDALNLKQTIAHLANSSSTFNAPEAITLSAQNGETDRLMLILSPVQSGSLNDNNHVSIFISSNKSQPIVLPDTVRQQFKLSHAEFAIASYLVRGFSIKEVADKNGTKETTVRTQIKAIFAKTETSRQAELIALLLGGNGAAIGYGLLAKTGVSLPGSKMAEQPQILILGDGRRMAYQEYGDPNGEPVFLCHSILGSRLERPFNGAEEAAARNIRLIVPDRPGRGHSTPHLDGDVLQWVDDLRALADHLDFDTFHIIGYAMGGLFAYASAYAMPERIKQIVLISSGQAPQSDEDFHAMQPLYSIMQKMARDFPRVHRLVVALMSRSFLKKTSQLIERLAQNLCESDKEILRCQDFLDIFIDNFTEVCCQGTNHYAHDVELAAHFQDWGFTPQDITKPIQMWHGNQDFGIPIILAEKFQQQDPNVTLNVLPDKGHYLFYDHWPMILDHMLDAQKKVENDVFSPP